MALVAILALAIVPTMSRLLAAASGGAAWTQVCTPQGMKPQTAGDEQPLPGPLAGLHGDHCALCAAAATPFVPPDSGAPWRAPSQADAVPALFGAAPRPLFAWAVTRPRGPPVGA